MSIWTDLMGAEVHYVGRKYRTRVVEAGTGTPLVLTHGGGGHVEHFSRNVMRLAEHFHVVAYEMLWHGYSPAPDLDDDAMLRFEEQLLDVMDTVGIKKAVVGGASSGAFPPMSLAVHRPERVLGLVLVVPGHIRTPEREATEQVQYSALQTSTQDALTDATEETIRTRLEWLMADPSVVTDELVAVRQKIYASEHGNAATRDYYALTRSKPGHAYDISEEQLRGLKMPTLLIWTRGGNGASVERGEWLSKVIPNLTYRVIGPAGHWPQWERPEEHDSAIIEFVSGLA
jgi:pimeloyl-ACP methyl ester carboxylesterase